MRLARIVSLILVALAMTGCNSKQIQEYARRLQLLLADYKEGVQARIDAERKLYDALGRTFGAEAERDVYESLKLERLRQQRILTGDLADGRLAPSQVAEKLRETALGEFDRTRSWFEQELAAQQQYQAGLAKVSLDAKKIDALDDALKAVQQDTSLKTTVSDVVAFRGEFKTEFGLQTCKDLEREISTRKDTIDELKAEKPDPGKDTEARDKKVDALTAEQTSAQAKLDANSHFTTGKKCQ